MARYIKTDYPLHDARRHLETGPIVLVSSSCQAETDIMAMGWHVMLQFTPALFSATCGRVITATGLSAAAPNA